MSFNPILLMRQPLTLRQNNSSYTNGNAHSNRETQGSSLPTLPPGVELPPGVTCTDSISRTLNTLPPSQLLDILSQMKSLATTDPARATELLNQAPQLSYAVFQALLLMGLVSPEAITAVMDNPSAGAPVPPPQVAAPPSVAIPGYPGFPPAFTNTPPVGAGYAPPPPQVQAPAPAAAAPAPDQAAQIAALMQLPQEVIERLAEPERSQVLALRAAFGGQRR
jgi:cleavage stimulation factor subunit 2